MSKSALFLLASALLVTVVCSKTQFVSLSTAKTPIEICKSRGYATACTATNNNQYCENLKCRSATLAVALTSQAPNYMWCGSSKTCKDGKCVSDTTYRNPEGFSLTVC
ncbi:uncharacterized protein [Venturia canescens]|uniref:uncharacterized protein n=1 Tax=Venturia canescens TaxID=32260 RepID=UPI001C9C8893|nr:uncharacterized protein LOC122407490 [Venturia canescens]